MGHHLKRKALKKKCHCFSNGTLLTSFCSRNSRDCYRGHITNKHGLFGIKYDTFCQRTLEVCNLHTRNCRPETSWFNKHVFQWLLLSHTSKQQTINSSVLKCRLTFEVLKVHWCSRSTLSPFLGCSYESLLRKMY